MLFVSYSTADAEAAAELRRILIEDGYRAWMAPDDIEGSRPWAEQIVDAVTAATMMVVVVSSDAIESSHVGREVNLAIDQGKPVLPVRIEEVALSGSLKYLLALAQWVDAFPPPLRVHRDRLSKRIANLLKDRGTIRLVGPRSRPARHNLPAATTVLLGRERDLLAVAEELLTYRCVTVVGTGGVGKTRFALQVASDALDRHPDGAWMVELATVTPDADIAAALVAALGLTEFDTRPDLDRLVEFIGQQEILLLFDNCEHVVGPVADLVRHLIRKCGRLRVLAASRERLHIPEELVYELSPLGIPAVGAEADVLASVPAVQLLALRAKEAGAADPLLSDPAATISVCRRVDGLPLALELAASRLRVMTIGELDASLAGGLRVLASRHPSGPQHHSTMAATIEWSRRLLDDRTQQFFPTLGVFDGGFDLSAAGAVGALESLEDTVELVGSLVEASLVTHVAAGRGSRYHMLEPIRQHALSLLADDAGREAQARGRHARHFQSLAIEGESHMFGHGQAEWIGRLDRDYDNIRAAFSWLADTKPDAFLEMAAALANYWFNRGLLREGKTALEAALSADQGSDDRRIDALIGLAQLCWAGNDYERGEEVAATALVLAETMGDRPRSVIARQCLARLFLYSERADQAAAMMERVRSEARDLGMRRWAGDASHFLGHIARKAGEYEQARALHRQARTEFAAAGDENAVPYALGAEAVDVWQLGQSATARELMTEANRMHSKLGDTRGTAEGKVFEALFELEAGNPGEARRVAAEGVRELRDLGDRRGLTGALIVLSRAVTSSGDYRTAALLLGSAESIFGRDPSELPVFGDREFITILNRELGAAEFEATVEEGRATGWDGLHQWIE